MNMTTLASLLLFIILSLTTIMRAQERAPHGLEYQSPMAFSPEVYDFFNPETQAQRSNGPCSSPDCSTLPEATSLQSAPVHESTSKRLGAGKIASIPIGLVFGLLLGLVVYYLVITRQTNAARARAAHQLQPDRPLTSRADNRGMHLHRSLEGTSIHSSTLVTTPAPKFQNV